MLDLNLTLWIQMALFLVFAGIMNVLFFRPVTKVLAERRAYVAAKHAEAKQDLSQIQALQQDYDTRMKAARVEAQEAIASAVAEAESKRQVLLTSVKAEVGEQIESARKTIRAERDAALNELAGDVSALATLIARKAGSEPAAATATRGGNEA